MGERMNPELECEPTQIGCKVVADSIAPSGVRLFTVECVYPWYIHNEVMTHRAFSRNSASSRAIPNEKRLGRCLIDPAIPTYWGQNQKGMQAETEVGPQTIKEARSLWVQAMQDAVHRSALLANLGVHKQTANRLVEPFCWMTTIISATEWANFFYLRCHKDAQPEMRQLAMSICRAYYDSTPVVMEEGDWHLPYITDEDRKDIAHYTSTTAGAMWGEDILALVSAARCARVSYLTHEGKRDIEADLALARRLEGGSGGSGHWSPMEHCAKASSDGRTWSGNFRGWHQFRQLYGAGRANWTTALKSPEEYWNRV